MMNATSLLPPVVEDCNKTTENICRVTFFFCFAADVFRCFG